VWEPEPSSTLLNVYRRQGITVGDVGILTESGGFDFMFNVCLPSDHPIDQEGLPDGFLPIFPQLKSSDIRKRNVSFKQSDKGVSMPPVPIFESGGASPLHDGIFCYHLILEFQILLSLFHVLDNQFVSFQWMTISRFEVLYYHSSAKFGQGKSLHLPNWTNISS
jgi:hypothetical protein